MEENTFWFRIWALGAAVLIAGIGSCSFNSYVTKDKWEKAVSNGADPLVVSCALGIGGSNSTHADAIMCNTLSQRGK